MPVIKRYPNRKLYDTDAKQYITLDGIATLIRAGEDVQVIDHASGEDLTTLTLSQIIFEQEKKKSGFLPRSVLTTMIQAGGERVGALRRTLASPLEALRHVDEEINHRVRSLISRGELSEEEGGSLLQKLLSQGKEMAAGALPHEEDVERVLSKRGIPTSSDLERISAQLDELAEKLDRLQQE